MMKQKLQIIPIILLLLLLFTSTSVQANEEDSLSHYTSFSAGIS